MDSVNYACIPAMIEMRREGGSWPLALARCGIKQMVLQDRI